ncbi:MAG: hypothetical protein ACJ73S_10265 [Mycobacteriales bacterium]
MVAFGKVHGWTLWQIAVAVHRHCGCGLLKAHRLAREWTQEEMARRMERTAEQAGLPIPSMTPQRICHWEAGERPSPGYLDLLCRLFATRPDRLGYGTDHTPSEDQEPPVTVVLPPELGRARQVTPRTTAAGTGPDPESEARRRTLVQASVANRGVLSAPLLDTVDAIRRQGEQAFEETALTRTTLDRLEENIHGHGAAHLTSPPLALLCDLAADYLEVEQGLTGRLAADLRQRLCRIAAQASGLIALVFTDLARASHARGWFQLGHQAADENGDRTLRAWLAAIEAFQPLFVGDYLRAITLAQRARALTRQQASPGSVLGYAIEAHALARLGSNGEALAALGHAEAGYERIEAHATSWLGYPRAAFLYHRADTLTRTGMTIPATRTLEEAADAYGANAVRGRAYVELCRATCDVRDGLLADGCERALGVLRDVPIEQRIAMVNTRAREVLDAVPPESRNLRAVRELKEELRGT